MPRSFLRERSICIECGTEYAPRDHESQEQWIARSFCAYPCSVAHKKRTRARKAHPPEVIARMEKRHELVTKRLEAINNKVQDNRSVRVKPSRAKKKEE